MNMTLPYDEWKAQQDENAAQAAEIERLNAWMPLLPAPEVTK
jgi:hypothetical protein